MMLRNCSGVWQPRLGGDRGIELAAPGRGQAPICPAGHLHILRLHGADHVGRLQAVIVQLERIEPDAHGILRAEDAGVADARHARDRVLHLGGNEVGNVDIGVAAAIVIDADHHDEIRRVLDHHHALLLHGCGQQRHGRLHLVLHLHLGDVGIGAGRERRR